MYRYITVYDIQIPLYGLMVILGFSIANILIMIVCKCKSFDIKKAYILGLYGGIGAFIGAKGLYYIELLLESGSTVVLSKSVNSGYSFYGGVLLGIAFLKIGALIQNIDLNMYAKELCFIIPIMHAFWKLGCFFAGCCYGIETNSVIGVVFPEGSVAPANIRLIPIQLIECLCLLFLSAMLWCLNKQNILKQPISTYVLGYSIPRFFTEFYRCSNRFFGITIAQFISLCCILYVAAKYVMDNIKLFKEVKS